MSMGDGRYDNDGKLSMEDTFVKHFMFALDRLQTTWMGPEGGLNQEKFNLQLLYLIRLLPDIRKQEEILRKWGQLQETRVEGLSQSELKVYAGMEVVSEVIRFICDSFELINTDIIGPATSKQYNDSIIEIPDYDDGFKPEVPSKPEVK